MYAIRIDQPDRVGSMIVCLPEEGQARVMVNSINKADDGRTKAEYLGAATAIDTTVTLDMSTTSPTARQQLMDSYSRALPHRIAIDVLNLKTVEDGAHTIASGRILGVLR